MDKLDHLFERLESLPPAPGILPRLLAALSHEESDLSEITDMITVDPALTAKLLQICNSAVFGKPGRVNAVPEAVQQLGFRQIYKIVAVVSGRQCLRPSRVIGVKAAQSWRHSVTVAFGAQFVAADLGEEGGIPFTAGLLHDVGKVILTEVYAQDYVQLIASPGMIGRALIEAEDIRYGMNHAEVGGHLLKYWKFSAELIDSVRFHHQSSSAGAHERLAACIEVADWLSHSVDGDQSSPLVSNGTLDATLTICGLSSEDITRYQDHIRENVGFVEAMCRSK